MSIPLNKSFTTWAGWLIPYTSDVYLILDDNAGPMALDEAVRDLAMIGFDRVAGVFGSDAIESAAHRGRGLEPTAQIPVEDLAARIKGEKVTIVDVRGRAEWEAGHLPGGLNIPLGYLAERTGELPRDQLLVLHCQSGGRSAMAASVLQGKGFTQVANLTGGFVAWERAGYDVVREVGEAVPAGHGSAS